MKKSFFILSILKIIFWIIFITLAITTTILFSTFFAYDSEIIERVEINILSFKGTFSQLKSIGKNAFRIAIFLSAIFCAFETYLVFIIIKILKKTHSTLSNEINF